MSMQLTPHTTAKACAPGDVSPIRPEETSGPKVESVLPFGVIDVLVSELIEDNIREDEDDPAALDRLGESLLKCQDVPIIIRPSKVIVDGHRRNRAARRKGIKYLKAIVVEGDLKPAQIRAIQIRTVVHRKGITDFELFKAVKAIAEEHKDWSRKRLAEELDLDPPLVTKLLADCCVEVEDAFRQGKISFATRYELHKLAHDQQPAMLAAQLNGGTRADITKTIKRQRTSTASTDRRSRIACQLPGGVNVVISAKDMSIDQAIDVLSDVLKSARKARDDGLTVKSWTAAMKDKANQGELS